MADAKHFLKLLFNPAQIGWRNGLSRHFLLSLIVVYDGIMVVMLSLKILKFYESAQIKYGMGYYARNQRIDHDCFPFTFP